MRSLAKLLTAHPRWIALAATLLTLVTGMGLLKLGFDIQPNSTISSQNEASTNLAKFKSTFGPDDNDIVLIVIGDDLLQWSHLEAYRHLRDQLRSLDDIQHVVSVLDIRKPGRWTPMVPAVPGPDFDSRRLMQALKRHPVARDQCVADDGRMLIMWARIKGGSLAVSSIRAVIDAAHRFAKEYEETTGARVVLAGHTAVRADVLVMLRRAMFFSCIAVAIFCSIVAVCLFRSVVPVLVVATPPALGSLWTFGLMGWWGEPVGGLKTALPNLMFAIGLTDAVHLLLDAQRHLRTGRSRRHAVYAMLVRVGPACLLTSLTTMIGFGSLLLSQTDSVGRFGAWAAIGTSLVVISDLVLLSLLLRWLPARLLSGRPTRDERLSRLINRMVSPTLKRAGLTTFVAVLVCGVLCVPAFDQHPDIVWTETIPRQARAARAMRLADEKMHGALLAYVMIEWPEEASYPDPEIISATADVQKLLHSEPGFGAVFSLNNILATVPGSSLRQRFRGFKRAENSIQDSLINERERSLVVTARVANHGAATLNAQVAGLERKMKAIREQYPEYRFTITGTAIAASKNIHQIIIDLARSLALAAILVFAVFALAFRCFRTGLLSVIPNAFPLLMAAASISLLGMPLQITTALTFSLCLGLAVDDTMHVLFQFRLARKHSRCPVKAIEKTIRHVGPALVVTTVILLTGFGSMLTSPLPGVRLFAALSGLTVLAALVADLLVLPAMLVFLDRHSSGKTDKSIPAGSTLTDRQPKTE